MNLENIGFYTLSDRRAKTASMHSPLSRCELILTGACNFKCPYCRNVGGPHMPFEDAAKIVMQWASQGLFAVRFSGGEPLLYPRLLDLVTLAKQSGINRIAVSSNGSLPLKRYLDLIDAGVNDLSISLDACCAEDGDKMAGGVKGAWDKVVENIIELSRYTYVTVGVVLTDANASKIGEIIDFAYRLGVDDIRVIPAAQDGDKLKTVEVEPHIRAKCRILDYRIENIQQGRPVRGLRSTDADCCPLVLDDMAVCGDQHYPCIIYLREGGQSIGKVGPNMRYDRYMWYMSHNTHKDPICKKNCLDVCVDYNNKFIQLQTANTTLEEVAA